jgi:hypothetical protein
MQYEEVWCVLANERRESIELYISLVRMFPNLPVQSLYVVDDP